MSVGNYLRGVAVGTVLALGVVGIAGQPAAAAACKGAPE